MLIAVIDTDFPWRKVNIDSSAGESILASTHMNADAAFPPISFSFIVSKVSYFFQMLLCLSFFGYEDMRDERGDWKKMSSCNSNNQISFGATRNTCGMQFV